jgi:DNA-binding IclR family transcriptional regulator
MANSEAPHGSADRLAYLLKLVAGGPSRFSLGDLARRAQLPPSTVHRLLQVLLRSGLVERGPGQSYRPGRELHRLASQLVSRFDLVRSARPILQRLVDRWHETAVLCAYSPTAHNAVIVDAVLTPHPLRFNVEVGIEIGLPWGSLGRAILAHLAPGEIEAVFRKTTTGPLTGRRRPSHDEFDADLASVREDGFARYFDPRFDLAGIAAPIFGADRELLGCIGVTMPSSRYQLHLQDDLADAVREGADELSQQAAIAY